MQDTVKQLAENMENKADRQEQKRSTENIQTLYAELKQRGMTHEVKRNTDMIGRILEKIDDCVKIGAFRDLEMKVERKGEDVQIKALQIDFEKMKEMLRTVEMDLFWKASATEVAELRKRVVAFEKGLAARALATQVE